MPRSTRPWTTPSNRSQPPPTRSGCRPHHLRDFTATNRMLLIAALAAVIGAAGAMLAWALPQLIAFFTSIFHCHTVSFADASPAHNSMAGWRCSCRLTWAANGMALGIVAHKPGIDENVASP